MRFSQVQQDLNNVKEYLLPISQAIRIQIIPDDKNITWANRMPGIQNNAYYPFEYQFCIDNQQYSILLSDGSFFQFFYKFSEEGKLNAARLAYYPCPIPANTDTDGLIVGAENAVDREDEFLFQYLYNWVDILEATRKGPVNTSHIRFDYDSKTTAHEPAHMQFGGINNLRLPASFFPLPFAFVELISAAIENCGECSAQHLGHAKNNFLKLAPAIGIISLSNQ